jgi:hypothetical protein
MWNVFVEAKFEDDVLTSSTIGELWIVKCQGGPDGDVLAGISYQLYRYCEQFMPLLSVGGGDMVLSRGTRRADTAVRIRPSLLNGQSDLPTSNACGDKIFEQNSRPGTSIHTWVFRADVLFAGGCLLCV